MNLLKKLMNGLVFFAALSFSAFAQNGTNLPYFNKIVASGNVNIYINQQNNRSIDIATDKNKDRVLIYVRDSFLYIISEIYQPTDIYVNFNSLVYIEAKQNAIIELAKNADIKNLIVKSDYSSKINLHVTSKTMNLVVIGSGIVNISGNIHYFNLQAKNATQVNAHLFSFVIEASLSNFADIEMIGKTDKLNIRMNDESFIKATELCSRICMVEGNDFSEANVYVTDSLKFVGKNSALLFFTGEPKKLDKTTSKHADIYTTPENNKKYALK